MPAFEVLEIVQVGLAESLKIEKRSVYGLISHCIIWCLKTSTVYPQNHGILKICDKYK